MGLPDHHTNFGFLSYHSSFLAYINFVQCTCILFSFIVFLLLPLCPSIKLYPPPFPGLLLVPLSPYMFPFSLDCSFILVHYKNPGPREIRRPPPAGTVRLCYNEFNVNSSQVTGLSQIEGDMWSGIWQCVRNLLM